MRAGASPGCLNKQAGVQAGKQSQAMIVEL